MITAEMPVKFERKKHKDETLLQLYRNILKPRMIEEKMLILLRQGKISKWFSGIGQEAISVGVATAMDKEEFILPMHRNLGVFTTRGIPLNRLFSQFKVSQVDLQKDVIVHSTLEHKNIKLLV
jgi:2-oxoisovalerate dehydrogenase E1 component